MVQGVPAPCNLAVVRDVLQGISNNKYSPFSERIQCTEDEYRYLSLFIGIQVKLSTCTNKNNHSILKSDPS